MVKAKDPIFAPIPYGDDRQITRTRRGIHCVTEMIFDPEIVYLNCFRCDYTWEMPLEDYKEGTGIDLQKTENFAIGGTGSSGIYPYWEYGQYDELAHDCCTGGMGLCSYSEQEVPIATFYPYTGCTGMDGLPTGGTGGNGEWTGGVPHPCLGDATTIYRICPGGSGSSAPDTGPKTFGGYPLVCPNCCRVNFEARFILLEDNLGLGTPELCKAVMVIDFQRIKSDLA